MDEVAAANLKAGFNVERDKEAVQNRWKVLQKNYKVILL
jgi:hypothetical protein